MVMDSEMNHSNPRKVRTDPYWCQDRPNANSAATEKIAMTGW